MQAEQLERRIHRYVEARCRAILQSEAVQLSLQARLDDQRRKMEAEVDAELTAERARAEEARKAKEAAIVAKKAEIQALHDTRKQEVRRAALHVHFLAGWALECERVSTEPHSRAALTPHSGRCLPPGLMILPSFSDGRRTTPG